MSKENEQEARESLVGELPAYIADRAHRTRVMEAADAYGDARELKGHVEACVRRGSANKDCGEGGYLCPDAPKQEA